MRPAVTMRGQRFLGRLPRPTAHSLLELALLALIAIQAARFFWVLVTPLGPIGDWRPPGALAAPPPTAALGDFDPFFRLNSGAGPTVVTGLNLKLYGVREDRATGRGSAIIALPDGTQLNFAVGEEIMPGVTLAAVGFDHVTISRGGAMEQIFLDQSQPAPGAGGAVPVPAIVQSGPSIVAVPTPPPPAPPPLAPPAATPPLSLQPRTNNNQITGLVVGPGGDGGAAFRAAGFAAGDVIVAINGQRVNSAEQALALARASGGQASLTVERGGRAVQMRMRIP